MDKEQAKEEIRKLVEYYNSKKSELDKLSELDLRHKLIDKLFKRLGWDLDGEEDPNEVQREEGIKNEQSKKKKADYVFRLSGVPEFVVEAKAIKGVDMDDEKWKVQTVGYAYNLACSWAVLTNFVRIDIFYVDREDTSPIRKISDFSDLSNFDENFERIWLLSKEAARNNYLEKEAEKLGTKRTKEKVGKQLYEDLKTWRTKLSNSIRKKYDGKYKPYEIEEIVQKIIDRLIFIRKLEDLELEERKLDQLIRKFSDHVSYYKELKEIFKYYRDKYNSGLFGNNGEEQECDQIDIENDAIKEITLGTYRPRGSKIEYNFAAIDADILGNIYEQYLAFILKETPKKAKLEGGRAHRKEQGIYYTPNYIVDYIVKNTVGEYIKNKTIDKVLEVKILDPACGSGSFLIKAFSEICKVVEDRLKRGERIKKSNTLNDYSDRLTLHQKITILLSCIHGVDLDSRAVEIAQLNLLLKLLEGETAESLANIKQTKKLLPMLNENIKNGNSLIDDKTIAGDKAFNWNERFKDIMNNGGFDVVIGNPPYVRADSGEMYLKFRRYMQNNPYYETLWEKWDLYIPFIERGIKILKRKGKLGFIIPDSYATSKYAQKSIEWLSKNKKISQIDFFENLHIFKGVGVENIIIFLENEYEKGFLTKRLIHKNNFDNLIFITPINAENNYNILFRKIINKPQFQNNLKNIIELGDICYVSKGMVLNSDEKSEKGKWTKDDLISDKKDPIHIAPYIEAKNMGRYFIDKIRFLEWGSKRVPIRLSRPTFPELYSSPKIMRGRMCDATLDLSGLKTNDSIYNIVRFIDLKTVSNKSINNVIIKYSSYKDRKKSEEISSKFNIKFLLAIINSFFAKSFMNKIRRSRLSLYPDDLRKIPIKLPTLQQEKKIVDLVDKMFALNKHLNELGDKKTEERVKIEKEIKETNEQIDQEVYKLYGLTKEEIKIVEESLK